MSRLLKKLKETPDINFSNKEEIDEVAFNNTHYVVSEEVTRKTVVHSKIAIGVFVATILSLLVILILLNTLSDDNVDVSKQNESSNEISEATTAQSNAKEDVTSDLDKEISGNFIRVPNSGEIAECIDSARNSINKFGETLYQKIDSIKDKLVDGEDVQDNESYLEKVEKYKDTSNRFISTSGKNSSNYNTSKIHYNPEIQKIVDDFKITGLRLDGKNSKIMVDGDVYYVNSVICQKPKVKLIEIEAEKLIFSDEKGGLYERQL